MKPLDIGFRAMAVSCKGLNVGVACIGAVLAIPAYAQQRPSDAELDGRMGMCVQLSDTVRDKALDITGKLNDVIAKQNAEISKLRAEIEATKKKE